VEPETLSKLPLGAYMDEVYINVPKLLARKVASCVSENAKIRENLERCTALSKMNLTNGSLHGVIYTQVD